MLLVPLLLAALAGCWLLQYYLPACWAQNFEDDFLVQNQQFLRVDSLQRGSFGKFLLSNIKLGPKVRMWGHSHWYLTPIMLSEAYDAKAPNRICDIYISGKLQGPAYVKNSTKPNACFIDRIIITPADPTVKVK